MRYRCIRWSIFTLLALGAPFLLLLTGCDDGGIVGINESTEIDIGRQGAADIERQYGLYTNSTQVARVQRIGRSIAAVSERPRLPWTFKILNVREVNAMALPGGPVYVTRGLLEAGVSDNELAGVMAHEVAHINERHSVQAIERAMTAQLLADLVLRGSGSALRTAANLAVEIAVQLPQSREAEFDADNVGTRLAYNAGYPANGMLLFLNRLQAISGSGGGTPDWLRTHPVTSDRIARLQRISTQVASQPRPVPVVYVPEDEPAAAEVTAPLEPVTDPTAVPHAEQVAPDAEEVAPDPDTTVDDGMEKIR